MSKLDEISTTAQINAWVEEHGGNYRDALNVALAQLRAVQAGKADLKRRNENIYKDALLYIKDIADLRAQLADAVKWADFNLVEFKKVSRELAASQAEVERLRVHPTPMGREPAKNWELGR